MSELNEIDTSYGHTDAKEHSNLMALTSDGQITNVLYASETHDFGSLADGVGETGSVAVNGAALGDVVLVSFSLDLQDMILTAYVQAANVVEYRLQNESTGTIDLASGTIRVLVFKAAD